MGKGIEQHSLGHPVLRGPPWSKGCRDISWLFVGIFSGCLGVLMAGYIIQSCVVCKVLLRFGEGYWCREQDVLSWRPVHLQRNARQSSDLISLSKLIISMLYCSSHSPAFTLRTSVCFSDREIFPGSSWRRHYRLWQKAPASLPLLVRLMEMNDETGFGFKSLHK